MVLQEISASSGSLRTAVISFLASPKPFHGIDGDNQRRAIGSWLAVHPAAEVTLYGRAPGAREVAASLGCSHEPDVHASKSGIPYFNAIVQHADQHARNEVLVYLNCDILTGPDLAAAAAAIRARGWPRYLVTGQRVDLAEGARLDTTNPTGWRDDLRALAERGEASLHAPSGMDYFVFPKNSWGNLAPLIIGRAGYDNALLAHCLRHGFPTVDATRDVLIVHQFHDYSHVAGGSRTVFTGADAKLNFERHRVLHSPPDVRDAHWILSGHCLQTNVARGDQLRALEMHCRFGWGFERAGLALRLLWRASRVMGLIATQDPDLDDLLTARELVDTEAFTDASSAHAHPAPPVAEPEVGESDT